MTNTIRGIKITRTYVILGILAFVYIGINIYYAQSVYVALYAWVKVTEYTLLLLYVTYTKPPLQLFIRGLSIAVFYTSCIGIVQYILQHSIGGPFWLLGERTFYSDTPGIAQISLCHMWNMSCALRLRAYSLFSHPNVFGGFLAITIPMMIGQIGRIRPIGQIERVFMWVAVAFGVVALALTFSRSAWIVLGIGIGISYFGRNRFILIILLCTVLVLGLYKAPIQDESYVVRQQLNIAAIQTWKNSPLIGIGAGNFLVALPSHLVSRQIYFLQPVHNIYLLLLSEIGVVGIALIVVGFIFLKYEYRTPNTDKDKHLRTFIIYNSVFSIFVLGLVDHYFLSLQQGQLLLTVVLAFALMRNHVLQ